MTVFVILFVIFLVAIMSVRVSRARTVVLKCYSLECRYNCGLRCGRDSVVIYNNGALGICLWHSSSMDERLKRPVKRGEIIGGIKKELDMLEVLEMSIEREGDFRAIKDVKEFRQWLKRHGLTDEGGKDG